MKIPETLLIGGKEIKVQTGKMDGLFGYFDPNENLIMLNQDNSPADNVSTLFHEIIHCVNFYNDLELELRKELAISQQDQGADPDIRAAAMEESITEDFAKVFLQVITDNNLLNLKAQ